MCGLCTHGGGREKPSNILHRRYDMPHDLLRGAENAVQPTPDTSYDRFGLEVPGHWLRLLKLVLQVSLQANGSFHQ